MCFSRGLLSSVNSLELRIIGLVSSPNLLCEPDKKCGYYSFTKAKAKKYVLLNYEIHLNVIIGNESVTVPCLLQYPSPLVHSREAL